MPNPVPVVLLGRLAVDKDWQGRGLGADLLRDAVLRMIAASDTIGVRAILIQAISDAAMLHLASEYPEGRSCRATGSQPLE
jgi:hypothetical protein